MQFCRLAYQTRGISRMFSNRAPAVFIQLEHKLLWHFATKRNISLSSLGDNPSHSQQKKLIDLEYSFIPWVDAGNPTFSSTRQQDSLVVV